MCLSDNFTSNHYLPNRVNKLKEKNLIGFLLNVEHGLEKYINLFEKANVQINNEEFKEALATFSLKTIKNLWNTDV